MEEKILTEITNFCECANCHECCKEEECVLFRIEQIVEHKEDEVINSTKDDEDEKEIQEI